MPFPKATRVLIRWLLILSGIAAVMVLVFFTMDRVVMPIYTRQGTEKAVPDLAGLSVEQARARADSAGFQLVVEAAKLGGNLPEGTILEQRPFAGSLAKPGRKVRVVPAMAVQQDLTPDLIGLEIREALIRCKNVDLICSNNDIQYRFSTDSPKDMVMAQNPLPGDVIERGAVIKLIVSLGPRPDFVIVPYVMEKQLHEARLLLRESGLLLGRIARKETDLYPTGTVIAQSIRSGEQVTPETTIDMVVAVPIPKAEMDTEIPDSAEDDTSQPVRYTGPAD